METQPESRRSGGASDEPPRQVAVDLMDKNPPKPGMLPVWFFIGLILLVYGVLIFIAGLYELSRPPETVLGRLHPEIWWGAIIGVVGGIYMWIFRPKRAARSGK